MFDFLKSFYYRYWSDFHPIRRWEWDVTRKNLIRTKVLDAGCGTGSLTRKLAKMNFDVKAIDLDSQGFENAKKYNAFPNVEYKAMRVEDIKYPSETFDTVMCISVMGQCDRTPAFNELYRVTKKGGVLIITSATKNIDLIQIDPSIKQERYYSMKNKWVRWLFNLFINFNDKRTLLSIVFYPIYWLDTKLSKGTGEICVLIIRK